MQFTAKEIATLIEGKIEGNPEEAVSQIAKIEEGVTGSLAFLANPKYEHHLYDTEASVVIVNDSLQLQKDVSATLIRVPDAYLAISKLLDFYETMSKDKSGREDPSFVDETAKIGEECYIGAFSYISKNVTIGNNVKIYPNVFIGDNTTVGDDTVLYPGVVVYNACIIGRNNIIHSGAVIGSDGFGFAPQEDGSYKKVAQTGNVVTEDNVEVGANTVLDRATIGSTVIRKGVKLDNLVQIAHNVEIGENSVAAAQTGISGSTKIGKQVILGGQVGVVGHIHIADKSQVQAQTGINRSLTEEDKKWGGTPVLPYSRQLRSQVLYSKLPEMEKRIRELEEKLKDKE